MRWWWAISAAAGLAAACDVADPGGLAGAPAYAIGGTARGVPSAGVRLLLEGTGAFPAASVRLSEDGAFEFSELVPEGARYALSVQAPRTHACALAPASGVVTGTVQVELTCAARPVETCPTPDEGGWRLPLAPSGGIVGLEVLEDGRLLALGWVEARGGPRGRLWWLSPSGRVADADRVVAQADLPGPDFTPTAWAWAGDAGGYVVGDAVDGDRVQSVLVGVDADGAGRDDFGVGGAVLLAAAREPDCENPGGPARSAAAVAPAGAEVWVAGEWSTPCQVTRPWVARLPQRWAAGSYPIEAATFLWAIGRPEITSFPQIRAAIADEAGGLWLAGRFWSGAWQAGVRRMRPDGEVDGAFGVIGLDAPEAPSAGEAVSVALAIGLDGGGRVVVSGRLRRYAAPSPAREGDGWMVWRAPLGSPLGSGASPRGFALPPTRPRARDAARGVAAAPDGGAYVAGTIDGAEGLTVGVRWLAGRQGGPGEAWRASDLAAVAVGAPTPVAAGADGCVWYGATAGGAPVVGAFRRAPAP